VTTINAPAPGTPMRIRPLTPAPLPKGRGELDSLSPWGEGGRRPGEGGRTAHRSIIAVAVTLVCSGLSLAADWPQFRGPHGNGTTDETNLPVKWSATQGVKWKAELPGKGVSSPVVAAGKVYVTCSAGPRDDQLFVLAFDATSGKELWRRPLTATGSTVCHPTTCMAAPTPVATADGVFTLFASGDLAAFDAAGNMLWYRSLVGDYPTVVNQVGMAASPVLAGGHLIVPMDNVGDSFIAAIDPKTGKNVWKTARPKDQVWVSPVVRTVGDKTEILFQAGKELVAYDAATGSKTWSYKQDGAYVPTPVLAGDQVLVPGRETLVGKLGTSGPEPAWKSTKLGTGNSSALIYRGGVYAANSGGIVTCCDAATGKIHYQERVKGPFQAAPVGADGKVYVVNEAGTTFVIQAGTEYKLLATNDLGERVLGTPAVSNKCLFVRTDKSLFCIGLGRQ
jgi:outer membrane protein assembly factor BamB